MADFGTEINLRRRQLLMKQKDLAEALGLKQSVVSAYEKNISKPTFEGFMNMCAILKCEPTDLCAEELQAARITHT